MNGAEESFALLGLGQLRPSDESLVTRGTGVGVADGEVLVALDVEGRKHLLIPYRMRVKDRVEGALSFGSRVLGEPARPHLDVVCTRAPLDSVFFAFCDHLLSSLDETTDAHVQVRWAVDAWKDLLRAGAGLSPEVAVGLVGEFNVLAHLAAIDPVAAWEAWTGAENRLHDFTAAGADLEVKATTALDGGGVQIHGLDQLDPSDQRPLHLIVHRVIPDPSAATLDDRIDALVGLGLPKHDLLTVVVKLGHTYSAGQSADEHRYRIRSSQGWVVDEAFPGLRRSRMAPEVQVGVSRVRYTLAVDSLPGPMSASAYKAMLDGFLGG